MELFVAPDKNLMNQKPLDPKSSIFSKKALVSMFVLAFSMMAILLPTFSYFMKRESALKAQTMVFCTMVLIEMIAAYISRVEKSIFSSNPFENKWLNLAVVFSISMTVLVVQMPPVAKIFQVAPLALSEWAVAFGLSLSMLLVSELTKLCLKPETK